MLTTMLTTMAPLLAMLGITSSSTSTISTYVTIAVILVVTMLNDERFNRVYTSFTESLTLSFSRHRRIRMEGTISRTRSSTFCHLTPEVKGLLMYMSKRLDELRGARCVQAIDVCTATNDERKTVNVPVSLSGFGNFVDLLNGISVKVEVREEEPRERDSSSIFAMPSNASVLQSKVDVTLTSSTKTFLEMREFLDECARLQELETSSIAQGRQFVFTYRGLDDCERPTFDVSDFSSNKTFDTLFFEGKSELISQILDFESPLGRMRSKSLGIQHALGLLFHGAAGTGKTSAIKAIASLTGRHVCIVPMDRIMRQAPERCVDVLKDVLSAKRLGEFNVPQAKRLWVFEEVDCWLSITKQRSSSSDGGQAQNDDHLQQENGDLSVIVDAVIAKVLSSEKSSLSSSSSPLSTRLETNKIAQKSPINKQQQLGGLLELLDGLVEMPDRMFIMTTNHPEKLDRALIRPGRVDIVKEFKKMNPESVRSLWNLWFPGHVLDALDEDLSDRWTQAELAQIFVQRGMNGARTVLQTKHG